MERKSLSKSAADYSARRDEWVDYPHSHLEKWDVVSKGLYPDADFATYPRGRLMYNTAVGGYVLYADKCVTEKDVQALIEYFDLSNEKVQLAYDEHYTCDGCIDETMFDFDAFSPSETPKQSESLPNDKGDYSFDSLEEFTKYIDSMSEVYLSATVLRGENELTGNLIEISNKKYRMLIELGTSLANISGELEEVERTVLNTHYDAVFITHLHADHAGLVGLKKDCKIYMGELTRKLMNLQNKLDGCEVFTYKDGEKLTIGDDEKYSIKVTPYLCDHSAPDSFMLLMECQDNRILYTGDFRAHGRKNFDKLLEQLPDDVDTLIVEGTNENAGDDYVTLTERQLQNKIAAQIRKTDSPVFVMSATTNIDRIVSVYKAASSCGRILLVDKEQARILETVGGGVPHPTQFDNVLVYYPLPIRDRDYDNYIDLRAQSIGIAEIAKRNDYVMLVRTSGLNYLKKLAAMRKDGLNGALLVYSLWSGYREKEDIKNFFSTLNNMGVTCVTIHTSGHANAATIARIKQRVKPRNVISVHKK